MIGIVCVRLNDSHDCVGRDESGDVIDVAVSIIAGDTFPQPDHLFNPEVIRENLFNVRA